MSNSKDGTKAKLNFTVREFKKVQKLFLRREREGRREGAGGSLLTLETRAGPVRTKSHHHLANNLGKVLVFFSLCAPPGSGGRPSWCSCHRSGFSTYRGSAYPGLAYPPSDSRNLARGGLGSPSRYRNVNKSGTEFTALLRRLSEVRHVKHSRDSARIA